MDLEEYLALKKRAQIAETGITREKTSLDLVLEELKKTYGCGSVKEAKARLEELKVEIKEAQENFESAQRAFEETYPEIVQD